MGTRLTPTDRHRRRKRNSYLIGRLLEAIARESGTVSGELGNQIATERYILSGEPVIL